MQSRMSELSEDCKLGAYTSVPGSEEITQSGVPVGYCGKESLH